MKTLLVTGTDTGVGKTWISTLLIRSGIAAGLRVGAYKPVCSGAVSGAGGGPHWEDVDRISAALGQAISADDICPQRFLAPLAPPVAARQEGRAVDSEQLSRGADCWRNRCDLLIVEGAGGLLCPLSDDTTVADLAMILKASILIVAANRLGVINHTLLTAAAARVRQIPIAGVVLNDTAAPAADASDIESGGDESVSTNAAQLRHWLPGVPLLTCAHGGTTLSLSSASEGLPASAWRGLLMSAAASD